ncbi:MAG TPA: hypothetical protein VG838_00745 [Opitutaceae bacterium]|nr:hypothetical protein [Lacunisphaera sp.]HWA07970.1 hypothetical protein [Opitutaceae bacterium]
MNTSVPSRKFTFRSLALLALAGVSSLLADPIKYDLSAYTAATGLTATVEKDELTVTWADGARGELRARYAVDQGQPVIRELSVRKAGGKWAALGQNLTPEFNVKTGHRRIDFVGLSNFARFGQDITSRAVKDREAWYSFWDAPFVIPGEPTRNPDLPRLAAEIQTAKGMYNITSCTVKTDGARLEVEFPGLTMGIFSGGIRFTHYRGAGLYRVEAVAKTDKDLVAYKYDVGLRGLTTATMPQVRWLDTGGNAQEYQFGGGLHSSPVTVRAKNRVMVAEGPAGSIAVFPPPTVFFPAREVDTNLGYVWYRKDAEGRYSFGVKQADHEDIPKYLQNFALYNAPPGTLQRMATYFYLSPTDAMSTRAAVMAYTHNDTFAPIPGYKTFVNHFHIEFTDRLRESGSLDTQTPDLPAMRALGINIIGLSDFHADKLKLNDSGPGGRFADQKDYFEGTRRASDKDFLILPWEEPSIAFGGHYNILYPRPLFYSKVRTKTQQFIEQDPTYGKVYHNSSAEDVQQMLDAENTYWYTAHPRTKSSAGYPDFYWDKFYVQNDHYLGLAFKPGMGMDLSESRLAEWRTFDALDTMNNMFADTKLRPKVLIADVDTYQKWPHDDIFPGIPVNYLKLDRVPGPDEDWGSIMKTLSDGNFFGTTGEIFIRNYAVQGKGDKRTIVADVDYTFPLEFVEVVWGDGKKIDRQIIRATELPPMGTHHYSIPFDATGKKWVRFAVWDSAVNGAFVQPIWLQR